MDASIIFTGRDHNFLKHFLFIMLLSFTGYCSYAQPVNDDACAPVTLTVTASCTYQTFTNAAATASPGVPAPGCASYSGGDVWFQVLVPAGGALVIDTQEGVVNDGGMAIYSGDCNNLVLIECDDDDSPNGLMPYISRSGLTPGSTIWVRFWEYGNNNNGSFGICVTLPPPPPANDNCAAATALTVNPSFTCTATTNATTVSATASAAPAPTCAVAGVNDDVWFSFVATGASHVITLSNVTGIVTDMAMSVYSGACGALVHVQCSDPNTMSVTGLSAGQTYYVRVWTVTATAGAGANFTICVGTPPPPPANDNCAGAINLTVNANLACAVTTTGTTASATASTATAPTCVATGVNDDVWYSFVAAGPNHTIVLSNVTGIVTDMAMSVYSGNCTALVHVQCSDPNTMTVNGLTTGQTYYVRVWTSTATAGSYANFTICVGTPPPPPLNDDPCNAISLTIAENGTCNYQSFTNQSATATTGVPAPGCASYGGGDVWFKVTVPCSGSLILDSQTGTMTDGGMALYTGTCTNLTLLQCDDDGSANGLMPRISRTGLVVGSTVWIRFWEFGNDNNGSFGICAQIPPPPPPAATCQTAQPFCTSNIPTTVPNITGQPSTGGGGIYGCLTTIPNQTYYYLQIQNTGAISITISQTSTTNTPLDVDFVVWGPFNNLNATCTGVSAANIVDCSYSIAAIEVADIPNAVAGQFYLFLVTNFSDQPGAITYQQTGGTGSSNCNIVCSLNAANTGPVCSGQLVNLTASTVANATYSWTGPNCFSSTLQNPTGVIAPITPGQYVYTVTATGPAGIACTDTTILTVSPKPAIGADSSIKICAGSTANLNTIYNTTGLTANWTLNGINISNPASVSQSGVYQLIVFNTTGCRDTANVSLLIDTVNATVTVAPIVCTQTGRITVSNVSGIPPYTYAISSNTGVYQVSNEFIVPAGTYIIYTKDSLGCIKTNEVVVRVDPPFTVYAGPDLSVVAGDDGQINGTASEPANNIMWTPSTGLTSANTLYTVARPASTTLYTLSAVNRLGCIATDNVLVTIIPYCVKVKNAFTPNGDGINDNWQVYDDYGCLKNISLHVYNRNGNKVFESRDYRNKWDGTFNGKPLPDATYYAVIDFTLITGRIVTVKTDLTILR